MYFDGFLLQTYFKTIKLTGCNKNVNVTIASTLNNNKVLNLNKHFINNDLFT